MTPAKAFDYAPAPESRAVVDIAASYGLFIDGEFSEAADGKVFKTISPSSEEVLSEVAQAGAEDVDRAVGAARRAFAGWSALPGASRHHWGSEIDVIDAAALEPGARARLVPEEFAPGGRFERLNGWLDSNMGRCGFFRPYATFKGGFQPEPWHLSYAEVSTPALRVLTVDVLREAIEEADMPGQQTVLARLPELYERYVLAIDTPV